MNEVIEKEDKQITLFENVVITEAQALAAYTGDKGLDDIVAKVRDHVRSFEHDLTTGVGRKRTASLSAKVSSIKVVLDNLGLNLTADWAKKKKAVDVSRSAMKKACDELRDEARKPLTDWENAEAERIKREAEEAEAERLRVQRENDHELAIFMNEKFDNDAILAKQEAERLEAEAKRTAEELAVRVAAEKETDRLAYEAKIREEAKAQAELEKREAIEREEIAKQNAIEAENRRIEQEKQAVINAENASIAAEKREIEAAENARIAEVRRQEELKLIEAQEQAAIMANKAHIGKIRKEAKQSLMDSIGLDEATAKNIVLAINSGSISHVSIKYWG